MTFTERSLAERGIARQVVRPSVCPSVCDVEVPYRDHTGSGWNSAKIISRLISLTTLLSADPNMSWQIYSKGNTPNQILARIGVGYVDFRHLSRRITESVQDMVQVGIGH